MKHSTLNLVLATGFAALIPLTFGTGSASAALIAYEGFDYPDGSTLNGQNGGTGAWNGAWTSAGGTVSGGEYFTGSSGQNSSRPITVAATTDPLFFSATFTKTSATGAYAHWLQLGADANAVAATSTVRIGLANNNFSVRIRQANGVEVDGDVPGYTVGDTAFIVGKLEYDVSGLNERLTIWVDPTSQETAAITSSVLGNVGWTTPTHAHIRNVFLPAGGASMDDIRIGSTWGSVVPEPSTALLGAFGVLCCLLRRRR